LARHRSRPKTDLNISRHRWLLSPMLLKMASFLIDQIHQLIMIMISMKKHTLSQTFELIKNLPKGSSLDVIRELSIFIMFLPDKLDPRNISFVEKLMKILN